MQGVGFSKPPSAGGLVLQLKPSSAFEHHYLDFCAPNAVDDALHIISETRLLRKSDGQIDFGLASAVLWPNAQNDSNMPDLDEESLDFDSDISSETGATNQSLINGLDSGWNRIKSKRIKNCLQYIPLYRNELLFFVKTLTFGGNLLLVISSTGLELLFGILEKINPLFMEKPVPIFPSAKFRAYPLFYILWRKVQLLLKFMYVE